MVIHPGRTPFAAAVALAAAASLAACSGTPVVPPAIAINTPPTIESVTVAGGRAEADQDVQVTASVRDAETPADRLTYAWSAMPHNGTFTGNGASATWRPPKGQKTPDVYTITLTVTEAYTSSGQARQNIVVSNTTVFYNDSPAEVAYLATDFLVDKFGNYSVSPAEAVSNFSDNCRGKEAEFNDITINRREFRILSAAYTIRSISINTDRTRATVSGECVFEDIKVSTGEQQVVPGICTLTNVYETSKWLLCSSTFTGTGPMPVSLQPGRVPGQIVGRE